MLTLFERLSHEQLPFYLRYMQHLARHGIPVPEPQADASGQILHQLCGRPAALVNRLPGQQVLAPGLAHIAQIGEMLARMHLAGADFPLQQPHLRGLAWWAATVPEVLPFLDERAPRCCARSWRSSAAWPRRRGGGTAARRDPRRPVPRQRDVRRHRRRGPAQRAVRLLLRRHRQLLFDLAVCLNDWCIDPATGRLLEDRAAAFCAAYQRVRPLAAASCG